MVYRRQVRLLIIYLTKSNQTVTRAFQTKIDVFPPNGSFALGQWIPSNDSISVLPNSSFNAKIEEFRIWKRRSNPSLIHRNPKINPTASYSQDLLHLFKFDNLSRHFVADELTSIRFTYQKWYPAIPQFSDLVIDFSVERSGFKNRTLEEAAMKKCRELFFEGEIHGKCEGLGYGIISRFYIECITDIGRANDINKAFNTLASFVVHCQQVLRIQHDLFQPFCNVKLQDHVSDWSGRNCSHSCIYGVWRKNIKWFRNNTNGTEDKCICEHGYWGRNCTQLCPGGILNTCNNKGDCDIENGTCSCRGNMISTYENQTDKLPCSECLPGWKGAECNLAMTEKSLQVDNKISDTRFCIVVGNMHFTTFDGTSLSIDIQGMYLLVGNRNVKIYLISKAYGLNRACRRIAEVFIVSNFGEASVSIENGKVKAASRKRNAGDIPGKMESGTAHFKPLIYWQSLLRDTIMRYAGEKSERLEIQVAEYYHILIFLYGEQFSITVEERRPEMMNVSGICGFSVKRHSSQMILEPGPKFTNGTYVDAGVGNKTVISQHMIAAEFAKKYSWTNSTEVLLTNVSKFWQNGPGYMVYFSHNRLVGNLLSLKDKLAEWTIELWIHPGKPAKNISNNCKEAFKTELAVKQHILSIEHQGSKYLSLQYNGKLHFEWDEFAASTNLHVMSNIWTHVSVSWRSYDGRLRIQTLSQCSKTNSFTFYNIKLGEAYSLDGTLVIGQYLKNGREILENDFIGAVDELRIWRYARSKHDTENGAKQRLYFPLPGLLLAGYFDEIRDSKLPIVKATGPSQSNATNSYSYIIADKFNLNLMPVENPPQWLPSTAPLQLTADYTVTFRTSNLSTIARDMCHRWFYIGVLNQYCSVNLPRTATFYYQACISDIAATENTAVSRNLAVSFALLCSKKIEIPVCKLRDIYDRFPICKDEEPKPVWTGTRIFLLVLLIILLLLVSAAITVYLRKSKRPQVAPGDRYAQEGDAANDETQLFERDSFLASSFQSLQLGEKSPESGLDGLVKTSETFLDDGDIQIESSPRRPLEQSKESLFNSYEEIETEF